MTAIPDARRTGRVACHSFSAAENPLGGSWTHLDPLLTPVRVSLLNGVYVAHGTQTGTGPTGPPYDDSNAYLSGFSLNHYIAAVVWRDPTIASTPNMEIELLLRWSDDNPLITVPTYGDTHADGYEININQNGDYFQVGRFKGALLASSVPTRPVPATGDLFEAQVRQEGANARIQCWWTPIATGVRTEHINYLDTASPPLRGNPGIGFYMNSSGGGFNNKLGFSSVVARDI